MIIICVLINQSLGDSGFMANFLASLYPNSGCTLVHNLIILSLISGLHVFIPLYIVLTKYSLFSSFNTFTQKALGYSKSWSESSNLFL